ncbi:MAG TPA: TrkH family potassium uptake protein [Longimicrobiales bacterium]|nr:TrkH family potassium uptake protein [Longimicrobiales bacterium]
MRIGHLIYTVSIVLLAFSVALALSAVVAFWYGEGDAVAFVVSALVSLGLGGLGTLTTSLRRDLTIREGYAIVSLTWIAVGVLGALPYILSGVIADPVAAAFESFSGFTTTGSTVLAEVEGLPHGVLFWRSLTQWLGGMGIILLGVAILPFLGVGGMRLFAAEVPGPTHERLSPRIAQTAKLLWYVYASLTAAMTALLLLGGMSLFDAVNHALTTLPTGGFSTRNASLAAYGPYIQYVAIVFMYLAGVNFVLHFRAITGHPSAYHRHVEWRFYTAVLVVAAGVLWAMLLVTGQLGGIEPAFRHALFQVVSLSTTTGFASTDYNLWPMAGQLLLVTLMFMGGMAGSTAGGIKVVRIYVLLQSGIAELRRSMHPRAVTVTRLGTKPLDEEVLLNILGFVLLFFLLFAAGVLALAGLGHDLETAIGASIATVANIGPGIGDVGAVDNFGWMGPWSHLILIFLMLVGRLEIFTVLLLFHPGLWAGARR